VVKAFITFCDQALVITTFTTNIVQGFWDLHQQDIMEVSQLAAILFTIIYLIRVNKNIKKIIRPKQKYICVSGNPTLPIGTGRP